MSFESLLSIILAVVITFFYIIFFFFFSSRRRHTRCSRDWSSDVCSSDLHEQGERLRALQLPAVQALWSRPFRRRYRWPCPAERSVRWRLCRELVGPQPEHRDRF